MDNKFFYWTPRVLAIVFILFISIFALDVFGEGYSFWVTLWALFMHLLPSFALIGITILAWKKELYGGIAFVVLGLLFTLFFNTYTHIVSFFLVSGPVFLIGILFILSSKRKLPVKKKK